MDYDGCIPLSNHTIDLFCRVCVLFVMSRTELPSTNADTIIFELVRHEFVAMRCVCFGSALIVYAEDGKCHATTARKVWKNVGNVCSTIVTNFQHKYDVLQNVRAKNSAGVTNSHDGVWKFTTAR